MTQFFGRMSLLDPPILFTIPDPPDEDLAEETFETYALGSGDSPYAGGVGWAGAAVHGANFRRVIGVETFESYALGSGDAPYSNGEGWNAAAVTGGNFARILGYENANGYSVGTGDAPYSSAVGLATPSINGVDIVTVSGSDRAFRVNTGGIAWQLSSSATWNSIQIGTLIHIPVSAVTGLTTSTQLRVGMCNGAGGIPGQVADASVGNAIFWRSVGWAYAAASGTLQAAANNAAQLGKIVSGTLSTANISTISRVGAISSAPAVVRCPVVITITKGSPNWTLAVTRRTTTTAGPGYDREEDVTEAATENAAPGTILGAQHSTHSATIAFDETGGAMNTFFLQFNQNQTAYFSGIWIARLS
jgi:hypothetical protein